jgi:hypothetical protein
MAGIVNHYQQKDMRAKKFCALHAKRVHDELDDSKLITLVEQTWYWLIAISKTTAKGEIIRQVTVTELIIWFKTHDCNRIGNQIVNKMALSFSDKYG